MKAVLSFVNRFTKKAEVPLAKVVPVVEEPIEEVVDEPAEDETEVQEEVLPLVDIPPLIPEMIKSSLHTVLSRTKMEHRFDEMVDFLDGISLGSSDEISPKSLCKQLVKLGHMPWESIRAFREPERPREHILDLLPPSWSTFVKQPVSRPSGVKVWRGRLMETAEGCKLVIAPEPEVSLNPNPDTDADPDADPDPAASPKPDPDTGSDSNTNVAPELFDASVPSPSFSPHVSQTSDIAQRAALSAESASDIRVSQQIIRAIQEQPLEVVTCDPDILYASAAGASDSGGDLTSGAARDMGVVMMLDVLAPSTHVLSLEEHTAEDKLAEWKLAANIRADVPHGFSWFEDDGGACVLVTCSEVQTLDLRRVVPSINGTIAPVDGNGHARTHTAGFTKCARKKKDGFTRRLKMEKSWGAVALHATGRFESIPLKCLDPPHNGITKRPVSLIRGRSARLQVTISKTDRYYLAHAFPQGHFVLFVALVPQGGHSGLLHARQGLCEVSLDVTTALNTCYVTTMTAAAHSDKARKQAECFLWLPYATDTTPSITSCDLKLVATNSIKQRTTTRMFQIGPSIPCALMSHGVTRAVQHANDAVLSSVSVVMTYSDFHSVNEHVRSGVPLRVARVPDAPTVPGVVALDQRVTVRWTTPKEQDFSHWRAFRIMCVCDDNSGGHVVLLIKTIWCPSGTIPMDNCDVTRKDGCKTDFDLPSGRFRFRLQVIGETMSLWSVSSDVCVRPTCEEQERLMSDVDNCCSRITTMDDVDALATSLHVARRVAGLRRAQLERGFSSLCDAVNALLRATLQDNSGGEGAILTAAAELQQRFGGDLESVIAPELVSEVRKREKRSDAVRDLRRSLGSRDFRWVRDCVSVVRRHGYKVHLDKRKTGISMPWRERVPTVFVCGTSDQSRDVKLMLDKAVSEVLPRISALEALEDSPTEVTLKTIKEHLLPEDMELFNAKEAYLQAQNRVIAMARVGDLRRLEDALRMAHTVDPHVVSDVYFRLFAKHYMARTQYARQGGSSNLDDATWAIVMAKSLCAPRTEVANAEKWLALMKEQSALRMALYSKLDFSNRLEMAIADIEQLDGAAHAEDSETVAHANAAEIRNEGDTIAMDPVDAPETDELEHGKPDKQATTPQANMLIIQVDDADNVGARRIKDAFDERAVSAKRSVGEALKGGTDGNLTALLLAFSTCLKLKCHGEFQKDVCGLVAMRHLEDRVAERGPAEQLDEALKLCEEAKVDKWKLDSIKNHLYNLGYARFEAARTNISRAILRDIVTCTGVNEVADAAARGAVTPSGVCTTAAAPLSDPDDANVRSLQHSPRTASEYSEFVEARVLDDSLPRTGDLERKDPGYWAEGAGGAQSEHELRPLSKAETCTDGAVKAPGDKEPAPRSDINESGQENATYRREGAADPPSEETASLISNTAAPPRTATLAVDAEVTGKPLALDASSGKLGNRENKRSHRSKHRPHTKRITAGKTLDDGEKMKIESPKDESAAKASPATGGEGAESLNGNANAPIVQWSNLKTLESDIIDAVGQRDVTRTQSLIAVAPRFLSAKVREHAEALLSLAVTEERMNHALQHASPGRVAYLKNALPRDHPLQTTSAQLLATMAAEDALEDILIAQTGIDVSRLEEAIATARRHAACPKRLHFASKVLEDVKLRYTSTTIAESQTGL